MQRFSRFSLAIAAALFLLLNSPGAWSAEPQSIKSSSCGTSSQEAIAAAEKALNSKDVGAEHTALGCILQAVKALEAAQPIVPRGEDHHPVLRLPRNPGGPGK
jgi:hypothetical protein